MTTQSPPAITARPPSTVPLYVGIARTLNWQRQTTELFQNAARDRIQAFQELLPSGSGIDAGTQIDLAKSTPDKIVLNVAFHHMNEGGMYDGWTEHAVTVTPCLSNGFSLKVGGRDRNQIKEYLGGLFSQVLVENVPEYPEQSLEA